MTGLILCYTVLLHGTHFSYTVGQCHCVQPFAMSLCTCYHCAGRACFGRHVSRYTGLACEVNKFLPKLCVKSRNITYFRQLKQQKHLKFKISTTKIRATNNRSTERQATFRRNVLPPSARPKNKLSNTPALYPRILII
jgi:hypothetical protein